MSKEDCNTELREIVKDDVVGLVDSEVSNELLDLLNRFRDVVALKREKLGYTNQQGTIDLYL